MICTAGAVVLAAIALVGWLRISDADLDHVVVVEEATPHLAQRPHSFAERFFCINAGLACLNHQHKQT